MSGYPTRGLDHQHAIGGRSPFLQPLAHRLGRHIADRREGDLASHRDDGSVEGRGLMWIHGRDSKALLECKSSIAGLRVAHGSVENQAVLDNNNEVQRLALAKRLREALKDAEITPADLARQLERTPQAVTGWLTTGRISKDRLSAFASVTGEELGYLVTGKRAAPRVPKVAQGRGRGEYRVMADLQHPTPEDARLLSAFRRMAPDRRAILLALAAMLSATD